jgi:nucleotide-binding universal stress UspA family protein/N-acetylglutamate synthase-like GNAT family acetyltransferase
MFPRVLVATDFSPFADRTLECIGEIPGMEKIVLIHVLNQTPVPPRSSVFGNVPVPPEKQAQQVLDEKGRYLEKTTGVPVTTILVNGAGGDTAASIIRTANNENISLIVMGARGKSIFRGIFLGSTSKNVIRKAGIDVLVMQFRGLEGKDDTPLEKFCTNIFYHVLCPVDFSIPSEKTLEYVKSMGFIRKVTLLNVIGTPDSEHARQQKIQDAEVLMAEAKADVAAQIKRTASIIRSGNPVDEICHAADELDVSLIMIARYGKSDYAKNIPLGTVAEGVVSKAHRPLFVLSPHISLTVIVKELTKPEFRLAEEVWTQYHQQKADHETDRIFGVFVEGELAAVARCRRHTDGLEVDGVFVPDDYRDRGYARKAVQDLVDRCGSEPLYMHSTLDLVKFYASFGFEQIPESALPKSIKERFNFAEGEMKGANVSPMRRPGAGIPHKKI